MISEGKDILKYLFRKHVKNLPTLHNHVILLKYNTAANCQLLLMNTGIADQVIFVNYSAVAKQPMSPLHICAQWSGTQQMAQQ